MGQVHLTTATRANKLRSSAALPVTSVVLSKSARPDVEQLLKSDRVSEGRLLPTHNARHPSENTWRIHPRSLKHGDTKKPSMTGLSDTHACLLLFLHDSLHCCIDHASRFMKPTTCPGNEMTSHLCDLILQASMATSLSSQKPR